MLSLSQQLIALYASLISKNLTDVCNNQLMLRINSFIERSHEALFFIMEINRY